MIDSMYHIADSIEAFKKFVSEILPDFDSRILTGEKQTSHITVGRFGRTKDGKYIFEIPRTCKELQDKILGSPEAASLKTRTDIKNFTVKDDLSGLE